MRKKVYAACMSQMTAVHPRSSRELERARPRPKCGNQKMVAAAKFQGHSGTSTSTGSSTVVGL